MEQIFQKPQVRPHKSVRWFWLLLALFLAAAAGLILYPTVEKLKTSDAIDAPPPAAVQEAVQPEPVEQKAIVKEEVTLPAKTVAKPVIPAEPVYQPAPAAPEGIRNRIEGEVPIQVSAWIDKDGRVVSAHAAVTGDDVLRSYFAQQAVEAVKRWRFRPAHEGREPVPGQSQIRFHFRRSGVEWN